MPSATLQLMFPVAGVDFLGSSDTLEVNHTFGCRSGGSHWEILMSQPR